MIKLLLSTILVFQVSASEIRELDLKRSLRLAKDAISKGYYFASVPFIKEGLVITTSPNSELDEVIDRVLENIGIAQFRFLPEDVLSKSNSLFAKIILVTKYIEDKKLDKAKGILSSIDDKKFISPLAYQTKGTLLMLMNDFESSRSALKKCHLLAQEKKKLFNKTDTRYEYFDYIKATCNTTIARTYYKEGKLKDALSHYSSIDMRSYLYPSVLLETAWTLYRLGDFQTSIGRALSFRAPFLDDYFFPEAEQLASMSFFKLCHWEEVKKILKYFDKNHYNSTKALVNYLEKNSLSEQDILKQVILRKNNLKGFKITDKIFNRIRNTPSFIYHSNLLHLGIKELKKIKANRGRDQLAGLYYNNAKRELKIKSVYLGYKIKTKLYKIANNFIKVSQVLSLLGIESHGFIREKLANRKEYQRSNTEKLPIVRTVSSVNWDFKGEFWSDEIGSYVWSKASQCPK